MSGIHETSRDIKHGDDLTPDLTGPILLTPESGKELETLHLTLSIGDPDIIAAISKYPEGRARLEYVMTALRIGVNALGQAQGQVDAVTVRNEGDRLIRELADQLSNHRESVSSEFTNRLREYFDPESGRFSERVARLLSHDGELEQVLREQIGQGDSELARTLTAFVGAESPLMKVLNPSESTGLLSSINAAVELALKEDRERVLREFSLDNKASALNRLVTELNGTNGRLSDSLRERVDTVVAEFSLDDENSALSRLVREVDRTQKQLSAEFSLDSETSALARLRSELLNVLTTHEKSNTDFQHEVRQALAEMQIRKHEAGRSTTHGHDFEAELGRTLQKRSQGSG